MSETTRTLRVFYEGLPDEFKDAPCAGVAVIIAADTPFVARSMDEGAFIKLCQIVTHGRAVDTRRVS
jgi:hypothetical protein